MCRLRNAAVLSWHALSSHLSKVLGGGCCPFFSLFLISEVRLSFGSLHLLPATNRELRTSRERTTSAHRMSSSDENEFEAQTYVSVETHVVPSPPPLPPLIEEERDRSGSSASSSSSSSASSCAPASLHSDDDRREEAEVHVVKEVVTVTEWKEDGRVEVVSTETTWETRSAEAQVEHTDAGRTSRRSSSSSSSSASSGKGRVVERRESAGGPKITLFVKVGDTLHLFNWQVLWIQRLTSWTHRSQT